MLDGTGALWLVLAAAVLLSQVVRCRRRGFYAPVAENQRMQGHVLNAKYGLDRVEQVDFRFVNLCYLGTSLASLAFAAVLCMGGHYIVGVVGCMLLYQVLYAVVSVLIAKRYRQHQ